jgi:protein-S-isoprenylcysteine O-methyltransferase Ste14
MNAGGRSELVRAAVGTTIFLVLAPGVAAGLVPWLLTGWELEEMWLPLRLVGGLSIVAGLAALLHAFARFVLEGIGTPAPPAPTERLVVGGLYRYVRNPMYLAVEAVILGQALLLGQLVLVPYALLFAVTVVAFVYGYEQRTLARRFGSEYEAYQAAVPAWLPRRRPWEPSADLSGRKNSPAPDANRV